jgi:threonine/homoserine/homoserine lactone efflux protein
MPPTDRVLTFALAAAVVIAIPGPSVLFIVGRAVSSGRAAALLTVIGNTIGEYCQVIAVAFGVGALVERSVVAFSLVKVLGAVYLVYLGVKTFRDRRRLASLVDSEEQHSASWTAARGAFVGVTNPKTVVFLAAILPQFVSRSSGHVPVQILLLGLVFSAIALVSDTLWAVGANAFRAWFARSPRRLEIVGGVGGLAIIAVGAAVALTGRKD